LNPENHKYIIQWKPAFIHRRSKLEKKICIACMILRQKRSSKNCQCFFHNIYMKNSSTILLCITLCLFVYVNFESLLLYKIIVYKCNIHFKSCVCSNLKYIVTLEVMYEKLKIPTLMHVIRLDYFFWLYKMWYSSSDKIMSKY